MGMDGDDYERGRRDDRHRQCLRRTCRAKEKRIGRITRWILQKTETQGASEFSPGEGQNMYVLRVERSAAKNRYLYGALQNHKLKT
jgi:hypothetical protein